MQNILSLFSLSGKKALIVHPENPYGKEIACGLAAAGAAVYLAVPSETAAAETVAALNTAGTPCAGSFLYEGGTAAAAQTLADRVQQSMGQLDILVENSAFTDVTGWQQSKALIHSQLERSHLSIMLTVQKLGTLMAQQGCGSVLLVSDYGALVGYDPRNYENCPEYFDADFSLIKGFIRGGCVNYARQSAGYLGEHGCRCNCIAYGPMADRQPAAFEEAFASHSHLRRLCSPEDVALAAIYLASDASSFITGITLPVDGGYTAK